MRIIFTPKADLILADIIKKYNLDEFDGTVKIDALSKQFLREEIKKEEIPDYIQKNLNLSSQKADQLSSDILEKIIPEVAKIPEEKFKDTDSIEEISKQIFGNKKESSINKEPTTEPKMEKKITSVKTKIPAPTKDRIKKIPPTDNKSKNLNSNSSDKYREPIE